jgi:hypothetical protein
LYPFGAYVEVAYASEHKIPPSWLEALTLLIMSHYPGCM